VFSFFGFQAVESRKILDVAVIRDYLFLPV